MKKIYFGILVLLTCEAFAQVTERWQAFLNKPHGIASIGVAEFQPGVYTVFANNCVDARCQTRQAHVAILDNEGNILSESPMSNIPGQQLIALHQDEAGRQWLEATNQQQTTTFWHQVNGDGQILKTFSKPRRFITSGDSVNTHIFKYPYGFFTIKEKKINFTNTTLQIEITDTSGNPIWARQWITAIIDGDSATINYRFHYLKNGEFLITYQKENGPHNGFRNTVSNYITKFGHDGSEIFSRRFSIGNSRYYDFLDNNIPRDSIFREPVWSTADCEGNIWISGESNIIIIDGPYGIRYTLKLDGATGEQLGSGNNILPGYEFNRLNRPVIFHCPWNMISFNQNYTSWQINPFPPEAYAYHHSEMFDAVIDNWEWPSPSSRISKTSNVPSRAIIDKDAYITTSNFIRTADKGFLLTTYKSTFLGIGWFNIPVYDTVSYMQIIKYDSLGITTEIQELSGNKAQGGLNIYPNPASQTISLSSPEEGVAIISDTRGKQLLSIHAKPN